VAEGKKVELKGEWIAPTGNGLFPGKDSISSPGKGRYVKGKKHLCYNEAKRAKSLLAGVSRTLQGVVQNKRL
jgi:hypothetical protein